jgi:chorismate mutase
MNELLQGIRSQIEGIDRELVALIARRIDLARRVGEAKREEGLPTLDPSREAEVVSRAGQLARDAGLDEESIRAIFWHLVETSRRVQREER